MLSVTKLFPREGVYTSRAATYIMTIIHSPKYKEHAVTSMAACNVRFIFYEVSAAYLVIRLQ